MLAKSSPGFPLMYVFSTASAWSLLALASASLALTENRSSTSAICFLTSTWVASFTARVNCAWSTPSGALGGSANSMGTR